MTTETETLTYQEQLGKAITHYKITAEEIPAIIDAEAKRLTAEAEMIIADTARINAQTEAHVIGVEPEPSELQDPWWADPTAVKGATISSVAALAASAATIIALVV